MAYELLDEAPKGRYEMLPDDAAPVAAKPSKAALIAQFIAPPANMAQEIDNLRGGFIRGAGSIGASLLYPWDSAQDALNGDRGPTLSSLITGNKPMNRNQQRRADMDSALSSLIGSDPNSRGYAAGQLGGEIAGTAGMGGLIGKGLSAIPALAKYAPVVQSGGMTLGNAGTGSYLANLGIRAAGGATSGAATAALIDPETIGSGAVAGAAMPIAVKGAQYAGKGAQYAWKGAKTLLKNTLGATTGTSAETISAAYNAGKNKSTTFLDNMRGNAGFDDVVESAKAGLNSMRADRAAQYRSGMMDISADKSVLNFAPVDEALQKVQSMGSYKGVQTNKNASGVVGEISDKIAEWRSLNPAEYHTPEGMDALKRAIGDIRDATQFGTPARRAADGVYNAVKGEITKQAPTYSKVMGQYASASDELAQIEKALSLGDKTSKDTAIRKLQSLMRNNAQTSYGNRLSLAQQLEQKGGVELTPAIAGQAMNTWTPRGITGAMQKAGGLGLAGASLLNPSLLAAGAVAPLGSPRLMGEALYKAGLLSHAAENAGASATGLLSSNPNALQIGRGLLQTMPIAISASQTARQ